MAITGPVDISIVLERHDVQRAQIMIMEECTSFDLKDIETMYWRKYKDDISMYKWSDIERICQTAVENLLAQGKIKVGSSSGYFIVVQPTNDIEQKTEEHDI